MVICSDKIHITVLNWKSILQTNKFLSNTEITNARFKSGAASLHTKANHDP